jgi:hypothetical protein
MALTKYLALFHQGLKRQTATIDAMKHIRSHFDLLASSGRKMEFEVQ